MNQPLPASAVRRTRFLYFTLGLLPFLLALLCGLSVLIRIFAGPEVYHWGDEAVLEVYTLNATRGIQLLGPYSRFGWNHPGPTCFYVFAPLYVLTGHDGASMHLTALLINLASLAGIVYLVYRHTAPDFPALVLVVFLVLYVRYWCGRMADIWNPDLVVLPFALLIFACAALALGHSANLVLIVLLASFTTQTHLGCAPTVAALAGVSILSCGVGWLVSFRRSRTDGECAPRGRRWPWMVAAVVLAAFLWTPTVIEEVTSDPGNIEEIREFFANRTSDHPLSESLTAAAKSVVSPILTLFGAEDNGVAAAILLAAFLVLLPLGAALGWKRRRLYSAVLCLLSWVGVLACLWSATRIVGELRDYLTWWASPLCVSGAVGAAGALLARPDIATESSPPSPTRRVARGAAVLLAIGVIGVSAFQAFKTRKGSSAAIDHALYARVTEHLLDALNERTADMYAVRSDHPVWAFSLGVVLKLYKAGVPLLLEPPVLAMLDPSDRQPDVKAAFEIDFRAEPCAERPDFVLVDKGRFVYGDVAVYLRDCDYIERHRYRGPPVRLVAVRKTHGDPQVVVDGRIPPDATIWMSVEALLIEPEGWVTVTVPDVPITGLALSADNNDSYAVFASRDGENFEEIGFCPVEYGIGIRKRTCALEKDPAGYRFIRVAPKEGDGAYSVGEIIFLVRQ